MDKKVYPKVFILTFCLIILIEGGLQLVSLYQHSQNARYNEYPSKEDLPLTILALGESTTAEYMSAGKRTSWPYQLEELVNSKSSFKVNVVNLAVPGTNSALILSDLEKNLDIFQPQIVITMMGINDFDSITYKKSPLDHSKLFKIALWLKKALFSLASPPIQLESELLPQEKVTNFFSDGINEKEALIKRIEAMPKREAALYFLEWGKLLLKDFSQLELRAKVAFPMFKRAFELYPYHERILFYFLFSSNYSFKEDHISHLKNCHKVIALKAKLSPLILHQLITVYDSSSVVREHLSDLGIEKEEVGASFKNYLSLHQSLRERKIFHLVMQYPTLPPEELKTKFYNSSEFSDGDAQFISNENLGGLAQDNGYDTYFVDRFAGTWGHTTVRGHHEIAKNALPIVLETIEKLKEGHFKSK